ncbi:unnamed protein product [Closterium sp. NIES-54]
MRTGRCVSPAPLASSSADVGPRAPRRSCVSRSDLCGCGSGRGLEIELDFWPYDRHRAAHPQLDEIPLHSAVSFDFCSLPLPFPEFHLPLHWYYQGHLSPPHKREHVVVASTVSGRLPAVSGSVTVSKKPPLLFAPKPPPSVLVPPNPPAPAPPAAGPHPLTAAAPHAHAPAGPAPVAPVAPVESPVPVVVVDAPPGAPILDAPHVSVALLAPVAAVSSSPHAVSATTGGPWPGEVGGGVAMSAPVLPTAATSVPPPDVQAVPDPAPLAAAPLAQPVPPPPAPSASAAAHGNWMHLPWVPPVAGMEFVTAARGPVTAQYPSLLPVAPAPPAVLVPVQSLVGPLPSAVVPEASLGQLWRLSEGLRAVHLIQVYGHAALSQGAHLDPGPRDECLDAADRLAELLAPVLNAPARGGAAGVGQLGTAVRGLRRLLHAGSVVDLIGATTVVVRELHRSLTGLLAVLDTDQM